MKTAYVASPYRADDEEVFEKQLAYTKEISFVLVSEGYDVVVPHLYYPLFLDDMDEVQREAGMKSALRLLEKCDVVFATEKVSTGMAAEIATAQRLSIPVVYFSGIIDLIRKCNEK